VEEDYGYLEIRLNELGVEYNDAGDNTDYASIESPGRVKMKSELS